MGGQRAEGASTETAPHDLDRVPHHLVGRHRPPAVAGVRPARKRQPVNAVHLRLLQRQSRRIDHHRLAAVKLHQRPGTIGVGLELDGPGHGHKRLLVGRHLFIAGQKDGPGRRRPRQRGAAWLGGHRAFWLARRGAFQFARRGVGRLLIHRTPGTPGQGLACTQPVDRAADVAQPPDRLAGRQPAGDFHQRPLPHAVDQQVGLGIQNNAAAHPVAPIVVMGQPPQAGLDAAGDNRHARVGLARPLAIHRRSTVGPPADLAAGAIGVRVADFSGGRGMVQHRVHVPGTDREAHSGPAERPPRPAGMPIRLAENGQAMAFRFEQPRE